MASTGLAPLRRTRRPCLTTVEERLLPNLGDGAELLHVDTPADWARGVWRPAHHLRSRTRSPRPGRFGRPTCARHRQRGAGRDRRRCPAWVCRPPDLWAVGRRPHHRRARTVNHKPRPESPIAMIRTELEAAGIDDPRLRTAYRRCRKIAAENGRTYFLATRLLAPDQRPAVHALYAFARHADDILDEFNPEPGRRRAGRSTAAAVRPVFRRRRASRRAGSGGGRSHRAPLRNSGRPLRGLSRLHAHGPHRHRLSGPGRAQPSTCGAQRKSLACRCFRCWEPSNPTPTEAAPYAAALGVRSS